MKKRIWVFCLLTAVALAGIIVLIVNWASLLSWLTQPPALPEAEMIFENAASAVDQNNIRYCTDVRIEICIGSNLYTEHTDTTVTLEKPEGGQLRGLSSQTAQYGTHEVQTTELYDSSTLYLTIQGCTFRSPLDENAYRSRILPPVLITPKLYAQMYAYKGRAFNVIEYTGATQAEPWLGSDITVTEASGQVLLSKDGKLVKTAYTASYQQGSATVRYEATCELLTGGEKITTPEDPEAYISISCPDAPIALEKAYGHLLEASGITAKYTDTTLCQAFGDLRHQQIDLTFQKTPSLSSQISTTIVTSNTGKASSQTTLQKDERFVDGVYSASVDGDDWHTQEDVNEETMTTHAVDILVSTIMLPEHIVQATREEGQGQYTLRFTANEAFAELLRTNACQTLYQDPQILSNQSQAYHTDSVTCYLTVDTATGLPLNSGLHYAGTYTINDLPYPLEFTAEQAYTHQ